VIVTVAGLLTAPVLSVTVRLNISDVMGAVNVGAAVLAPFRETGAPDVCTHRSDTIVPPFEELPAPTSVTSEPWITTWPALAIGCDNIVARYASRQRNNNIPAENEIAEIAARTSSKALKYAIQIMNRVRAHYLNQDAR
jgi:hypothetical protein